MQDNFVSDSLLYILVQHEEVTKSEKMNASTTIRRADSAHHLTVTQHLQCYTKLQRC